MNSRKSNTTNNNHDQCRSRKKTKSIIVSFFISIIVLTAICVGLVVIIQSVNKPSEKHGNLFTFFEIEEDYDIMSDPEYLQLNREIHFENPERGVTVSISKDDLKDVPADQHIYVSHLCNFISYAINGNTEALNALFSDEYVEAGGKLKNEFTMQQLYNIKITYVQTITTQENGDEHESCEYWLEYMIRKNNGTFRNDMESDSIRKEYVRVTDRDGTLGIDVLSPYRTITQSTNAVTASEWTIIIIIAVLFTTLSLATIVFISKRRK